jgi:hypothetical protein
MDTEYDHTLWFSVNRRQYYEYDDEDDQEETPNTINKEKLKQCKGACILLLSFTILVGSYYILSQVA